MKDYSQFGEQTAILAAFNGTAKPGRVLDVGAFHATDKSNSRALIELGWEAILIEPSPGPLRGLVAEYGNEDRVKVISAAVAVQKAIVPIKISDDGLSTTESANIELWKEKAGYLGYLWVPTITLEDISLQFGHFDFINIDTEGTSVDLFLRMMELEWEPQCICCEHDKRLPELLAKATERGYNATLCNGTNVVLVRR